MRALPVLVALVASTAFGQMLFDQGPPKHRLVHRNTFAARYNALGLFYDGRFMYRLRLFESESTLLRDNFIGVGLNPMLSPAFGRIGPYVEFQPLSALGFWASYLLSQYVGTFSLGQSFPSARSEYSDARISELARLPAGDPGRNYLAGGTELHVGMDFQVKFDQYLLRTRTRFIYSSYALRAGDTVLYDQTYDITMPNQGWTAANDLDLLWQSLNLKIIAGLRYSLATAFYDARHFQPGEEQVNDNFNHRLGPFLAYTFKIKDGATWNSPTVFLLIQWYAKHRYRSGQVTSAALPMIGAGFQISGDFLDIKKKQ
ncbi:MAG: hypothetical protein JNG84_07810 [Archangium sp.]|nr:hypothetical protein [Archangium sp.]